MQGVYTLTFSGAVTAAQTLIQLKAGAAVTLEVLRAWISQSSVTADDTGEAVLLRYDTAATVTAGTPVPLNPTSQAAKSVGGVAACGVNATVEGTVNIATIYPEGFSVLGGWTWLPTPEEQIYIPPGGFLGLKSNRAIDSANLIAGITFREL